VNRTRRCSILPAVLAATLPFVAGAQLVPLPGPAEGTPITAPALPSGSTELSSGGVNATRSEAGVELEAERFPSSPAERLRPVMRNDITYLCGGVGEEESAYMKSEASSYDLMLTFAARGGAYLADVGIEIADAGGKRLLQARCDSPMMLVDLPRAGSYRIRADANGHVISRSVKVNAGRKTGQHLATAVLTWPRQAAEKGLSRETASGSSGAQGPHGTTGAAGAGGNVEGNTGARGMRR